MCLIVFDWQPNQRLVLSANRDEFFNRAAAPLAVWQDVPEIIAGRDLSQGGTWLGLNQTNLSFAALTNVRVLGVAPENPPSRGELVRDFLTSQQSAALWSQEFLSKAAAYAPFNLLVCDGVQLWYVTNYPTPSCTLVSPGIHALSNAQLDSPWPKAELAKQQLSQWLAANKDCASLAGLLSRRETFADDLLPHTGVALEWERLLSAQFIKANGYGTRCSTGLLLTPKQAEIYEMSWDINGQPTDQVRLTASITAQ